MKTIKDIFEACYKSNAIIAIALTTIIFQSAIWFIDDKVNYHAIAWFIWLLILIVFRSKNRKKESK